MVFFCENNLYGMSGSIKEIVKVDHIADRAAAYRIPGHTIDGNDVLGVAEVTAEAVKRAKNGEGPTLIEAETYRWRGHSRSDARKYRSRDEEKDWRKNRDPIESFKIRLIEEKILTEENFLELEQRMDNELEEALKFAEESNEPTLETLTTDIYA